jgi:hypothetical protein
MCIRVCEPFNCLQKEVTSPIFFISLSENHINVPASAEHQLFVITTADTSVTSAVNKVCLCLCSSTTISVLLIGDRETITRKLPAIMLMLFLLSFAGHDLVI